MKLNYTKILLFFFPLNILVTSYHAHNNKNKPSITSHHTQRYTSRVLSECDIQSSIYDNDAEMKSMKENFDRQTSQRFDEYGERMKVKRQKYKEQRDKNVQEIIEKDKREKSLAQKVETGCLMCGCGLGGVAASVGIFGGLGAYGWKSAATATAMAEGAAAAKAAGEAVRIPATIDAIISGIEREFGVSTDGVQGLKSLFTANTYNDVTMIARAINSEYNASSCLISGPATDNSICTWVKVKSDAARVIEGNLFSTQETIKVAVKSIVSDAQTPAAAAVKKATDEAIQRSIGVVDAKYAICQTAIIASVVALLIIVLVMIIIYLVLRYRRKKKMNKRAHYTKLLNQ
ncbi:rifin [Plasmodium falciparum IGH-CR14]|uniref:Rifin n=1 Tax=Plasmodium falciparum IGH-CR14 TaxID=580059 RepID=A0A0L1I736_PLAFA|nr:rifin [Plasmodium falciparum IGH-CR14]